MAKRLRRLGRPTLQLIDERPTRDARGAERERGDSDLAVTRALEAARHGGRHEEEGRREEDGDSASARHWGSEGAGRHGEPEGPEEQRSGATEPPRVEGLAAAGDEGNEESSLPDRRGEEARAPPQRPAPAGEEQGQSRWQQSAHRGAS